MKRIKILNMSVSGVILVVGLTAAAFDFQSASDWNKSGNSGNDNGQPIRVTTPPECMDNGQILSDMNQQVIQWKTSTANEYLARAVITGTVEKIFPDETGHAHFSVKIGPNPTDNIEVVYSLSFGDMNPQVGDTAVACGDYITANSNSGGYQPSPDGAIIHWVHRTDTNRHDGGYVILNNLEYGQGNGTGN